MAILPNTPTPRLGVPHVAPEGHKGEEVRGTACEVQALLSDGPGRL